MEGTTLALELHAPGADIVGFEYAAKTAEERAAIDAAVATLARPLDLFVVPATAECTVVEASAKLQGADTHDDHDHGHSHDDHAHAEHDHDAAEAEHAEFHAAYVLNCANPDALSEIGFAYFETFENARKLEVQIVSETGAQAAEVTRSAPELNLRGMF
ncbi:DUF2796 domain-containing protein [Roseobacter sp. WL0113]|uniref:DUF2796 domain-containing protein n=2 Tax=Roseobacter sinensis TaxID=2931391 RepID=A0ABT3BCJ3_9RHOB|nr:DUF2796 domain-containing protein [Roseobacter sp. WL0113]